MPVHGPNKQGKYSIGSGPFMYNSRRLAERAYAAYLAKKHSKKAKKRPNE